MKTIFVLIVAVLLAGCATNTAIVPDPLADPLMAEVTVHAVDWNLDGPQEHEGEILWNHLANKPYEEKFGSVSTAHWFSNWQKYSSSLVQRAKQAGLDSVSLDRCLKKIEPSPRSKTALLPVGAFSTTKGHAPVWIIACKWEVDHAWTENGVVQHSQLGHIRIWALRAADGKQVDFVTCM